MIQLFGRKKGHDTKKAERFFKERKIKVQQVDLDLKGLSKKELLSVIKAVGSMDDLVDQKSAFKEELALYEMASEERKIELLLDYPELLRAPIVRNSPHATVGVEEKIWKSWID